MLTFKRVYLNLYDTQAYAAEFYAVGAHQSMNAYPTWYYYEKSEVWIETEKMYEVLYELTV